jgi:hypothetical protein
MKKSSFVPKPDQLESRVVLSSMPKFSHGAAILTRHALGETYSQVQKAFTTYVKHGQNFNKLEASLAGAVSRIPYNHRDGLLPAVESEASQMRVDVSTGAAKPISSALQRALNDVNEFVQGEVSSGTIVLR